MCVAVRNCVRAMTSSGKQAPRWTLSSKFTFLQWFEKRGAQTLHRGSSGRLLCCSFHLCSLQDPHCPPQLCKGPAPLPPCPLPLPRRALPSASFPRSIAHIAHRQPAPGTASLPHLATINFAFNLCCIIAFSWGFPIYIERKMQLLGLEIFCYLFLLKCEAFLSVLSGDLCYSGTDFIHLLNAL